MESPAAYPESPMELEDTPCPCQGCGQILEEGKAFELSGKRWHIDCFRCSNCNTQLGSDANLLQLGDGSLICSNCTYSCSSCHNKIEDLAILTGDQAFCANCFTCRNCKNKIENLRYARTSQGIFCMDCYESLMARRRKKTQRNTSQKLKSSNSAMHLDKSLPSLPPTLAPTSAVQPEGETPPSEGYSDPAPLPVRNRPLESRHDQQSSSRREISNTTGLKGNNLNLPSSTYKSNRHSMLSYPSDDAGGDVEDFIPLAFDPTPTPPSTASPRVQKREERPRDYFSATRKPSGDSSRQADANNSQHIAYLEKDRRPSADIPRRKEVGSVGSGLENGEKSTTISARPDASAKDDFKLQDVPRARRSGASSVNSKQDVSSPPVQSPNLPESTSHRDFLSAVNTADRGPGSPTRDLNRPQTSESKDSTSPRPSYEARPRELPRSESAKASPALNQLQQLPKRGDSLEKGRPHQKEVPVARDVSSERADVLGELSSSARLNGAKISKPMESPTMKNDLQQSKDSFTAPRVAPPAPAEPRRRGGSTSTIQSDHRNGDMTHPNLLRYSGGGDFSMDEDMARIMGSEDGQNHESFLRRVSNSVRHGRSFSDKGSRLSRDGKWPRSPVTSSSGFAQDISSPMASSPDTRDELSWYKNELRRERQKLVEREQKIVQLESALGGSVDINKMDSQLKEKRSTIVVLDTQKELVIRELEILTEHIAASKKSGEVFDPSRLKNIVLREFAQSLEELRKSFTPQIEDLTQKRNDLLEEVPRLSQLKDKALLEFEQLSLKNAQLAELNNSLVNQIQGIYKANTSTGVMPPSGLGIYSMHSKDKSTTSFDNKKIDEKEIRPSLNEMSLPASTTTVQQEEAEPATILSAPQVINIRKGGQPKKFNWMKGSQSVAKGVTKGLKGAFSSDSRAQRDDRLTETAPYGALSPAQELAASNMPRSGSNDPARQGFGFFGNPKSKNNNTPWKAQSNGSSHALNNYEGATTLFGSELSDRVDFEKSAIPGIVTRCIEEVELRGMDVEGIYRKSGGNSQIVMIKEGFEKNYLDYDISDPDLDIHAVTSALKQYFRRLPNPLITYEVYDMLLDATNIQDPEKRIDEMRLAIDELPPVHRDVLEFLIFHLRRVVDREKENLMTSLNIAVVFAPTIMRPESLAREMTDTQKKNESVTFMVENCQAIFMGHA